MPKKKNKSYAGSSSNASPTRNWGKVKGGTGGSFKDASVPVNTKSRKVPSGC